MDMFDRKVTILCCTRMSTTVHPFIWSLLLLLWAVNGFLDQTLTMDVSYWRWCSILYFYAEKEVFWADLAFTLFFSEAAHLYWDVCLQSLIRNVINVTNIVLSFYKRVFQSFSSKSHVCIQQILLSSDAHPNVCHIKLPEMEQMILLLQICFLKTPKTYGEYRGSICLQSKTSW